VSLRCGGLREQPDLTLKISWVVEVLVDAREPQVGDLVEIPKALEHDMRLAFLIFSISVPIELLTLPFAGVLEGRQRYGLLRGTQLVRTVVWIAAVLIVLPQGGGLVTLSAANLGAALLGLAVTAFAAFRLLPAGTMRHSSSSLETLRGLFSFSINMFLTQLTGVLYRQMDRIIIIVALSSVALAQYEVASRLQLLAALSLTFTVSALFPAASSLAVTEEGRGRLKTIFLEGTKYSCGIVLPVTIALMIWADDLVLTWIGPEFEPSIEYSRWFLAWVIPTAATALGHTIIVGMGYVRQAMLLGLASALINLALSIILVRPYGVMGVIVGPLVGYCLVWYPSMRLCLRIIDVTWGDFWRRSAAPVLMICIPWAAIVVLIHLEVSANTVLGAFGAAGLSIVAAWVAIFFLALRSDERREVFASVRALAG